MAQDGEVAIPVPYISHIKLGHNWELGQTLIIQGEAPKYGNRFEINFLERDIAFKNNTNCVLHISVRFDANTIVFNTAREGYWENEEVVRNPLERGDSFDLRIRTQEHLLQIMVNDKEIHQFKVRIPLTSVDYLIIAGEVSLKCVRWDGKFLGSSYDRQFNGARFQTGNRLYVYGTPTGEKFEIDLLSNDDEIPFHFNPRFSEKAVVRNSLFDGAWGKEEREHENPFTRDKPFTVVIHNEPKELQVFVDGKWFCSYEHRCSNPEKDYSRLHIEGDLQLQGIEFSL